MDLAELSQKDLLALAAELELENETLQKDVTRLELEIEKNESRNLIDSEETEIESAQGIIDELKSVDDVRINKRLRNKTLKEPAAKYKIRIQRLAVNQNLIMLSDTIPSYDLQALTRILTEKQSTIANKASDSVNKRLKRLLNSLIPWPIRRIYLMYPWTVRRCPGFIYTADYTTKSTKTHTGHEVSFWATPDIPYYFRQGTEVEILNTYRPDLIYLVDNAVNLYFNYKNIQETKALSIATRLIKNNVQTYFDLLMYNPYWFEILYNLIKDGQTDDNKITGTI